MRWMYGIWFVPGEGQDFLAQLWKEDGKWVFDYRFRYYSPDSTDPHDGKDEKHGYRFARVDDGRPETLATILGVIEDGVVAATEQFFDSKHDFVRLECDEGDPKFFFELSSRDWAHPKLMPNEGAH